MKSGLPNQAFLPTRVVDALAADLFAPLLRPQPPGARWVAVSHDAEQGLCLTLACGDRVLLIELEDRDEGRDCYARTRRFNVCVRPRFGGGDLTESERRLVAGVVATVRQREVRLPVLDARPTAVRASAVREVSATRVLIPEGRGQYYLNPYAGCMIGCPYCYVGDRADLSRALEGQPQYGWGRWVDVKVDAPERLWNRPFVRAVP